MEFVLKYWVEFGFGILTAGLGGVYSKIRRYTSEQYAVKLGIQALLRNEIIQIYNKCVEKEYCPIYSLENIEAMYLQYKALGGNGTITELVERVRNMPSDKKRED